MVIFFVAFSQNLNFSSISSAKLISSTSSTTGSLPNCQAFVQPFENTEKEGTRARRAATMVELGCAVSNRSKGGFFFRKCHSFFESSNFPPKNIPKNCPELELEIQNNPPTT